MTADDANKLLALAKANYSYAFKTMTKQEKVLLVQSWAFALQDIPADIVMLAFMQLLTTSKWLPTVAEIREKIQKMYYQTAYSNDLLPEADGVRRAKKYIADNTWRLRGDGEPEISLDTILRGPYMNALGNGQMSLTGIAGGADKYLELPEMEEDE